MTSLDDSVHAVTVPGAVDAWARLLGRTAARAWTSCSSLRSATPRTASWSPLELRTTGHRRRERIERSDAGRAFYLPAGMAPVAGQRVQLPVLAKTLRRIARHGRDAFYGGEIAERMVAFLQSPGRAPHGRGPRHGRRRLRDSDQNHYRGLEVFECPPNGQGVIALQMLNILEGLELAGLDPDGPSGCISRPRRPGSRSRSRRLSCRSGPGRDPGRAPARQGLRRPAARADRSHRALPTLPRTARSARMPTPST